MLFLFSWFLIFAESNPETLKVTGYTEQKQRGGAKRIPKTVTITKWKVEKNMADGAWTVKGDAVIDGKTEKVILYWNSRNAPRGLPGHVYEDPEMYYGLSKEARARADAFEAKAKQPQAPFAVLTKENVLNKENYHKSYFP